VKEGGRVEEAIQVTLSLSEERTRRRELNGLAACASELGAERLTVLTMGEPGRESHGGVEIEV
jgi:predicted AAA+ superfamily ATPase